MKRETPPTPCICHSRRSSGRATRPRGARHRSERPAPHRDRQRHQPLIDRGVGRRAHPGFLPLLVAALPHPYAPSVAEMWLISSCGLPLSVSRPHELAFTAVGVPPIVTSDVGFPASTWAGSSVPSPAPPENRFVPTSQRTPSMSPSTSMTSRATVDRSAPTPRGSSRPQGGGDPSRLPPRHPRSPSPMVPPHRSRSVTFTSHMARRKKKAHDPRWTDRVVRQSFGPGQA